MGSSSWFPTPSPRRWTRTGQTLTRYHPQWPDPGRPKLFQATLGRASFDRTHRFVFSTTWTILRCIALDGEGSVHVGLVLIALIVSSSARRGHFPRHPTRCNEELSEGGPWQE